jgi:hypothetical protein
MWICVLPDRIRARPIADDLPSSAEFLYRISLLTPSVYYPAPRSDPGGGTLAQEARRRRYQVVDQGRVPHR